MGFTARAIIIVRVIDRFDCGGQEYLGEGIRIGEAEQVEGKEVQERRRRHTQLIIYLCAKLFDCIFVLSVF